MSVYRDRFDVVAAKLGDDAAVLGACAWAKQETWAKRGVTESEKTDAQSDGE